MGDRLLLVRTKILNAIVETQNKALVKGQIRNEIGKFAKSNFTKQQTKRPASQPTLEPPKPKTRSFDEVFAMSSEQEPGIKRKDVPFGASTQKQRVDSTGLTRERFAGRLVR